MKRFLTILLTGVALSLGLAVPAEAINIYPSCTAFPAKGETSLGQVRGAATGSCDGGAYVRVWIYEILDGKSRLAGSGRCTTDSSKQCTARTPWVTKLDGARYRVTSEVGAS